MFRTVLKVLPWPLLCVLVWFFIAPLPLISENDKIQLAQLGWRGEAVGYAMPIVLSLWIGAIIYGMIGCIVLVLKAEKDS